MTIQADYVTGDLVAVEYMGERVLTALLCMPLDGEVVLWVHGQAMPFAVSSLLPPTDKEREDFMRQLLGLR